MTTNSIEELNPGLKDVGRYEFGWSDADDKGANVQRGLSEEVVRNISGLKDEPEWMLAQRLKGLRLFGRKPMPVWGAELDGIDFDNIKYFVRSTEKQAATWDDLPEDIKNTYDRLGIPEAEKQRLVSGVAAQYESEVVYHSIREDLEEKGVLFLDTDTALKEHPELFEEYFGTVIPVGDNKFSALNTAVWSGGSFIYVPKGVHVDIPLQAYFRINTENMGQFERTLIIADEDSYVHYVEGCTAPIYSSDSLHSAVVEIVVKKGARVRYTTIQNWSNNVYNLVTKRAVCEAGATMEWVDGNIGSKVTMKYPAVYLMGEHARGETLSIAFAGEGQHQDAGAKMVHAAPHTSSSILSKSVARGGGRTSYRGLLQVMEGAHGSASTVKCDALLVDQISRSDTYPYVDVREDDVTLGHEATVSKVSDDQLFYFMQRGMEEDEAMAMIVRGFVEPIARELPMEYALELNRLIELQMEGAVG
ncbi:MULTISPECIES: Fe-S cluster assembly protein SufB [unclassified Aeromicrobium]|uniref:Fe-S cluster assembly protein SufB n=1 Tax=unclassified Aeromicrobium TaxID=2633570 RepID=UPI0006F7B9B2|nr:MULTISPECIES: Fe-S cluster assembly protein SufB [unclassified Aeromicrobium]RYY48234.1 MAG: Fe-S cluster assembly protein SufB [Actinomycetales bacterium]KQO39026.1 Fe-S cluster assembly protein SufB [Aeromicrobium sp. Leaf245]KQP24880.1 Fe-S cluster assembly protein SufB [Aeromicrobium sp. Leaf272]KQP79618.1 Fe-S cluster assembly protein SufB [Aeromicrobium sp. Leaf289]KQP82289.1 Fe-S cluster assembly protein SufB [Aeromicrobium sp. Leaf291]